MSIQLTLLKPVLRFQIKRRFKKKPDVFELRAIMDEAQRMQKPVSDDITVEQITLGDIPVERLAAPNTNTASAFFYIHGGGWVAGSPKSHRALTWRLAKEIGIPVFAVDYRLAPEHFFPAGLNDCVAAYKGLLATGVDASKIVVGGDSAGGNLTLALTLRLKAEGLPLPGALVCLSPATDMTHGSPSGTTNAKADTFFIPEIMKTVEPRYYPGHDAKDPYLSPLFGDVTGFPPTLFQVGDTEMLLDDSTRMAEKMKEAGVTVSIEIWPRVWHVWQVMADMLPEGRLAIGNIASFVRLHLNK